MGGVLLVAVIGAGTAATLRGQNDSAHALTASRATAAYQSPAGDPPLDSHLTRPTPVPSPIPVPASAPAPPRAAPPAAAAPARPAISVGSTQQALINKDRASAGLGPLTWSSCLYNVALSNAKRMAAQGYISHTNGPNLDLTCRLGNQAGENVGWWSGGINDPQLNAMFWASPDHRANILGPYRYVATAWAVAPNGAAYIAVEFG
ncbi:MAG TPA: CAP domain-containing protein [Candidatus Dormibacteraeota bacterium]|nr:CAP domain-containing protein [Candidatus Dormibacteraeota bacterium]